MMLGGFKQQRRHLAARGSMAVRGPLVTRSRKPSCSLEQMNLLKQGAGGTHKARGPSSNDGALKLRERRRAATRASSSERPSGSEGALYQSRGLLVVREPSGAARGPSAARSRGPS